MFIYTYRVNHKGISIHVMSLLIKLTLRYFFICLNYTLFNKLIRSDATSVDKEWWRVLDVSASICSVEEIEFYQKLH